MCHCMPNFIPSAQIKSIFICCLLILISQLSYTQCSISLGSNQDLCNGTVSLTPTTTGVLDCSTTQETIYYYSAENFEPTFGGNGSLYVSYIPNSDYLTFSVTIDASLSTNNTYNSYLYLVLTPGDEPFAYSDVPRFFIGDEVTASSYDGSSNCEANWPVNITNDGANTTYYFEAELTELLSCLEAPELIMEEVGIWLFAPDYFNPNEENTTGEDPSATVIDMYNANTVVASTNGGSVSYLWNTGETSPNITISNPGTYCLTMTDCEECETTDCIEISDCPEPSSCTVDLGPDQTMCNDPVTLTPNFSGSTNCPNINYSWYNSGNNLVGNTPSFSPANPGLYCVTIVDCSGNFCSDCINVIQELPDASITGNTILCSENEYTTLTVSGGDTYAWNTGHTAASIVVGPGTYSVTVSEEGCSVVEEITVSVASDMTGTISGETTLCSLNETTILSANGGSSYQWNTGQTTQAITVGPGEYSVTISNGECSVVQSIEVILNEISTGIIGNTSVCSENGLTNLTATGDGSYNWSTGHTSASIMVGPGQYSVIVSNGDCSTTESVVVTANGLEGTINGNLQVCSNNETTTLTAQGGSNYEWSNGQSSQEIEVGPGTYTVTISNGDCSTTESVVVTIGETTGTITGNTTLCSEGGTTTLTAEGGSNYEWSTGQNTPSISVGPGTYTVTISNGDCSDTQSIEVVGLSPEAGNISLNNESVCPGSSINITSTNTNIPVDFELVYLLTSGSNSIIQEIYSNENFSIAEEGMYNIVPFVYDADNWGVSSINLGTSSLQDLNEQINQSDFCGDINLNGASLEVIPCVAAIGNFVWLDDNKDGIQGGEETGIPNVAVQIRDQNGVVLDEQLTDENGLYLFDNLQPGSYQLSFPDELIIDGQLYIVTEANEGNNSDIDSNPVDLNSATDFAITPLYTITSNETLLNIDAGYGSPLGSIGNFTFNDANNNGVYDQGGESEMPIDGIEISIFDLANLSVPLQTTVSDENGFYEFTNLDYNLSYVLQFTAPDGFVISSSHQSASEGINNTNDASPTTGYTDIITLDPCETNYTIDAGFTEQVGTGGNLKVFLQGASQPFTEENSTSGNFTEEEIIESENAWTMTNNLSMDNLLPNIDPYATLSSFGHVNNPLGVEEISNELMDSIGATDWVYIELRNEINPNKVITTRSAILTKTGELVDVSGNKEIVFPGIEEGKFYVAIRHRNHLGVMTANPIDFTSSQIVEIDFTNPTTETWGEYAQVELDESTMALWAGDANMDGKIVFQGPNEDNITGFFQVLAAPENDLQNMNYIYYGYSESDIQLDCEVKFLGVDNENDLRFFNVVMHPGNSGSYPNFVIKEQLPE